MRREIRDCSPYISQFLSFNKMAATEQMPRWWAAPTFTAFLWSFLETMLCNTVKSKGAFS